MANLKWLIAPINNNSIALHVISPTNGWVGLLGQNMVTIQWSILGIPYTLYFDF